MTAVHEPEDVRPVVHHRCTDFFAAAAISSKGVGTETRIAKQRHLLDVADGFARRSTSGSIRSSSHGYVVRLRSRRPTAPIRVRDVPAVCSGYCRYGIPGLGQRLERPDV